MRRLKWFALSAFGLIVIVVAVVILRLDSIVRYTIETQSTASLGVPTGLKRAHVSLLGGSLDLTGFSVSSPGGFGAERMFQMEQASVGVTVGRLRDDPIRIDRITIDQPKLVIEHADGKFNFKVLTDMRPQKPVDNSEPLELIVQELTVSNAQVVIRPGVPGLRQEIMIPIPSFTVKDIGTGEGANNGAAIKEVVLLVVTDLARKAAESERLPEEVRMLLRMNADQIKQEVRARVDQQIDKIKEKIGEEAGKAIEKGIGDLINKDRKQQK
jgi:uncharacterized spore protein YtfJ